MCQLVFLCSIVSVLCVYECIKERYYYKIWRDLLYAAFLHWEKLCWMNLHFIICFLRYYENANKYIDLLVLLSTFAGADMQICRAQWRNYCLRRPHNAGGGLRGPMCNTLNFFLLTSNAYLFPLLFFSLSTSDASDKICSRPWLTERTWSMNCGCGLQPCISWQPCLTAFFLLRNFWSKCIALQLLCCNKTLNAFVKSEFYLVGCIYSITSQT